MAHLSNQLLLVTILAYVVAMLGYAAEWAFSTRTVVGRVVAQPRNRLVGAGGPTVSDFGGPGRPAVGSSATGATGRTAWFGQAAVVFTVVGLFTHIGTLLTRATAAGRVPWGNMYEFLVAVCLAGSVVWVLLLMLRPEARPIGVFVTLIIVLLLGTAGLVYTPAGPLMPALNSYWLAIHVSAASISSGIFLVGFVAAALHLIRNGYEQGKTRFPYTIGARVPSAERLERLTFRVHAFAFPIWTFAVICGAIWAEAAWGRYWGWDPKETWSFIAWVAYACYLHARATLSVKRTTASWIAVVAWTTMMVNLFGINLVVSGLHSYAGVK